MKFLHEYVVVIMLVSTLGPKSICHSSYGKFMRVYMSVYTSNERLVLVLSWSCIVWVSWSWVWSNYGNFGLAVCMLQHLFMWN